MDINLTPARRLNQNQILEVRAQADDLLERLYASRDFGEQVLAENGDDDPIRTVTGRTAIEQAIDSTTDMIQKMDRLIGQRPDGVSSGQLVESKRNR